MGNQDAVDDGDDIINMDWIRVIDRLPDDDTRINARYLGVYDLRENILFWLDVDGTGHFGGFSEIDGKGSQPATHWQYVDGGDK
jgi:Protein of unknown function (DUF551)